VRKGITACLKEQFENAQYLEYPSAEDAKKAVQREFYFIRILFSAKKGCSCCAQAHVINRKIKRMFWYGSLEH
jgi:hypothetical protein